MGSLVRNGLITSCYITFIPLSANPTKWSKHTRTIRRQNLNGLRCSSTQIISLYSTYFHCIFRTFFSYENAWNVFVWTQRIFVVLLIWKNKLLWQYSVLLFLPNEIASPMVDHQRWKNKINKKVTHSICDFFWFYSFYRVVGQIRGLCLLQLPWQFQQSLVN